MSRDQLHFAQGEVIGPAVAPLVLIGLCGQKAAGKDIGAERLVTEHGFTAMGFSDAVRREARERHGISDPTVGDLIRIGNEGRQRSGDTGYWAGQLLEMIREQGVMKAAVQGIRNPGEIQLLSRQLGDRFVLIGITAPLRIRANRLISRGRSGDPTSLEAFMDLDDADRGVGQPHDGQRTDDCLSLVDFDNRFVNGGDLDAYHAWLDKRVDKALHQASRR